MSPPNNQNVEEREQKQFERSVHQGNLQMPEDSNAPETLKYVAKPEDIESPVEPLEWINSRSTSTTNLSEDDVRSKEWVIEYHRLMSQMERPPDYGIIGHRRAWVYDDVDEYKMPLGPNKELEAEGFSEIGKESSARSKDGWATETATKDTKESIMRDDTDEPGSGGLLSRIK